MSAGVEARTVVRGGPRYRHLPGTTPAPTRFRLTPTTPIIGGEIDGLDLTAPIDDETFAELESAFADRLVLFFRNQPLTAEQHLALGRRFGTLHRHPAAAHGEGHPEILTIHADAESARANGEGWHSDVSCDPEPPAASILHISQCPPSGGDTLFASMYAAYEALSPRMQAYVAGLEAVHDGQHIYRSIYASGGAAADARFPTSRHPVVRTHPVTGRKALFVNRGFTTRILGVPADEGDAVLQYLFKHAENPLWQCRFRWEPDSVAMWDNRCAQHHAMWDYWPATRHGRRVTVAGDRPF